MRSHPSLDPQLRAALALAEPLPLAADALPALRAEHLRGALAAAAPPHPGVETEGHRIRRQDGRELAFRLYRPAGVAAALPALLWFHGGGYVIGSVVQDDALCEQLVLEARCVVVSVEYALAPEHPYPAALEDAFAVLCWVSARGAALGIDPGRVALGGASAGAGLAASLALVARDRGAPTPRLQLLIYPMLDRETSHDPARCSGVGEHPLWTHDQNRRAWQMYTGHLRNPAEAVYASPVHVSDLHELPPAWVGVGDLDLFYGEDQKYAAQLRRAGVPTVFYRAPGAYHAFHRLAPEAIVSQQFRRAYTAALRRALHARADAR